MHERDWRCRSWSDDSDIRARVANDLLVINGAVERRERLDLALLSRRDDFGLADSGGVCAEQSVSRRVGGGKVERSTCIDERRRRGKPFITLAEALRLCSGQEILHQAGRLPRARAAPQLAAGIVLARE